MLIWFLVLNYSSCCNRCWLIWSLWHCSHVARSLLPSTVKYSPPIFQKVMLWSAKYIFCFYLIKTYSSILIMSCSFWPHAHCGLQPRVRWVVWYVRWWQANTNVPHPRVVICNWRYHGPAHCPCGLSSVFYHNFLPWCLWDWAIFHLCHTLLGSWCFLFLLLRKTLEKTLEAAIFVEHANTDAVIVPYAL